MSSKKFDNLINGEWVSASEYRPNINPSNTEEVIGEYAVGGAEDVARAISAARAAQPEWAAASPQLRFTVLDKAARAIEERADELGELLAREEGKPLGEAKAEVGRAAQLFHFFAGEAVRNVGEIVDSIRPGLQVELTREPLGVVGVISPWNFPIAIPAWKIAPALAFGNAVVFKPADLTPGCAWELTNILHEAGVPAGVLNLVMGPGSKVGSAIAESPEIDAVTFTGSQAVGSGVAASCAANGVKVQCEMGGKNPLVVLEDADLDKAADIAINGAFFSTGQRCTASSRLIVTAGIHDEFVSRLKEKMTGLTVGSATAEGTVIGPVSNESQLEGNLEYVEIARKEGGEVYGGNRLELETPGYYMEPALITGTSNDMRINQEEVFGPVASVIKVADYEEALAVANDVDYGLSSGICTSSLARATDFKQRAQAGMVMVNAPTAGVDPHVSFGGWKASSYGPREQGRAAREFYTRHKTSYTNPEG
ncbi:aldehyde dehydrogenase family protein [Nesterenkonia sp. MY13]|uniref:Aldehyde dehydrogenase family protein n=1 Tax=Nesterenkonia sedimenti TaxID=1463632 RepID=A0A7X8TM32_9MICC|nr:aldehyde dehydrogenase family protein [Nesterenkonia sedimenti]NLS11085.1 aldehyde dehydrogenase family protein [Nesterenkonia sedimenti]